MPLRRLLLFLELGGEGVGFRALELWSLRFQVSCMLPGYELSQCPRCLWKVLRGGGGGGVILNSDFASILPETKGEAMGAKQGL